MNNLQSKTQRKLRQTGIAAAALLTFLGLFVALGSSASPPEGFEPQEIGNEGPWRNAGGEDCGGQGICAEWPNWDTNTATVCCISGTLVGTYNKNFNETCYTMFGERAI